ncbi:thioredoxin [Hokovirus HKV1]|uniref:Thioredoxin n=1 Tax=Hokovirus HKV1 TaxID=1977638 RepID=A0A1V0SH72_9VIRU|nr:thioredoxin [Hokovirus HKV1]
MNKIILYYANWCGHCEEFLPEWKKLISYIENKKLPIECEHYEESNIPKNISDEIEGFPTIIIIKEGKKSSYTKERTKEAILKEFGINIEQDSKTEGNKDDNITITLFHWKDCMPCKMFIGTDENPGEWQKFKDKIDQEIKKGNHKIMYREYERSSIPTKYKDDIVSFPTLLIEQNDKKPLKYTESRKADKIYDFLISLTSQSGGFDNMYYKYKYQKYKSLYKKIKNKSNNK